MKNLLYILLFVPLFFVSSCEEVVEEENIPNEVSFLGSMWTAFYPDDFQGYNSQTIFSYSLESISLSEIQWWIVHSNGVLESDGTSSYQWIGNHLYLNIESQSSDLMQLDGNILTVEYEENNELVIINFHKQ